jgi:hypothetical protein
MTVIIKNPGGRPRGDAFDIEQRRHVYRRLKVRLGMTADEIAELTGLAKGTTRNYPGIPSRPNFAPTSSTLDIMRRELIRRARAAIDEAEAKYAADAALTVDVAAAERRLGIGQRQESEAA